MKRNFFVCLVVFIVALALALPAVAQEKKDKPKSEKIKNALIVKAAQPDASGNGWSSCGIAPVTRQICAGAPSSVPVGGCSGGGMIRTQ